MKKQIAGKEVDFNEEGYLIDPTEWNEAIAHAIAVEENVGPLTEAHFKLIHFLREQHANGQIVTIRGIGKSGVVTTKDFYDLFPGGPLKKACRIAGIPKPVGCI